jgi:two-component system probable response regulator PhcQ
MMRRILILDDEVPVLHALQRALHLAFPGGSVHVEAFTEPVAALMRVGEQDFDIVVSDFRMPGLTGVDVLHVIKSLQPDAVRIVLSATTERGDIVAAVRRADVFRYLAKPWQSAELIATLHAAFAYRDARIKARPAAPSAHERELQRLEREEPGMTHVDRDADGNVRLF